MMGNPYDIELMNELIGQPESQHLEFKSSRDLLDEKKRGKFISEQVVRTVSAFLNTDGGKLIIGLEEKDGVAVELSPGVPRNHMSWDRLQSSICGRIQPAVAGYISVFAVQVRTDSEQEKLFAFVVDVKPGTTAYQADDKKYYVRRSGQSEPMEDKDIRLRMLAGDKPRLTMSLHPRVVPNLGNFSHHVQSITWILSFENVGIRNIPRAIVRTNLNVQGLTELGKRTVSPGTQEYKETAFQIEGLESSGLLPGQRFELPLMRVSSLAFVECQDLAAVVMTADVVAYIDDGLPCELRNYDLMADTRPIIERNWTIAVDQA